MSNERPAESSGVIDHCRTAPPVERGTISTTLELLSNSISLGTYSTIGTLSSTVMLMYTVAVPPEFVAFTVNMVRLNNSIGVPLRTPVEVSNERPFGSAGLMVQEIISPAPVNVGARGRSTLAVSLVMLKSSGR